MYYRSIVCLFITITAIEILASPLTAVIIKQLMCVFNTRELIMQQAIVKRSGLRKAEKT